MTQRDSNPLARLGLRLTPGGMGVAVDPAADLRVAALEGVTLQAYATLQAQRDHGDLEPDAIITAAGLDEAGWDRVVTAWTEALGQDPTHELTTLYGQWYVAALRPDHPALQATDDPSSDVP